MLVEEELTGQILGAGIEVHKVLGPGLLESAYEECLCHELDMRGIAFRRQVELPIEYKGILLTCGYRLDLVVDDQVIVERATGWLKVAAALAAYAGMRSGEVRAFEVRDIDFEKNRIIIRRAMSEKAQKDTKDHERSVPVAGPLLPILKEAAKDKLPKARVVVTKAGTTPSRQKVWYRLTALLEAARYASPQLPQLAALLLLGAHRPGHPRSGRSTCRRAQRLEDDPTLRPRPSGLGRGLEVSFLGYGNGVETKTSLLSKQLKTRPF